MWLLKVSILFILVTFSHCQSLGKCCNYGQILEEYANSTYNCIVDKIKRHDIFATEVNILKSNLSTKCIDYSTEYYEFEILEEKIVQKRLLDGPYFTKCCPLGYIYEPKNHSCVIKGNYDHTFIHNKLIKVGLPQCRIVVDSEVLSLGGHTSEDEFCEDETKNGFVRRQCKDENVCSDIRCVKKCCRDGQSFVNGSHCVDTYTNGIDLKFSTKVEDPDEPFAIVHNTTRCSGKFYLMSETRYIFNLLKNGEFQYWKNITNSFVIENPIDLSGYCIEYSNSPAFKGFFFFNCIPSAANKQKFNYTKWPKILSCVFLGLTILIYILLNQTKKLFGKILINYCISTLCMYALLTYAQSDLQPNDLPCQLVGFFLIFFATVSFAWLNVMCCDIWLTFGSTKHSIGVYQRRTELKKLIIYMTYGWGMPLLLTLLIYIFSIIDSLPDSIRPYVGTSACFIVYRPGNYAPFVFFRLPHLLIQILNAYLFLKTILYCLRIKNEIERINDTKNEKKVKFNRDKEKLFLIIKLAVIMGITFIVDTVSGFVDLNSAGPFWRNFEIVIDCINCLQGVYIFIIFICKRSVYNDFLKKLHLRRRDAYLSNTESFTTSQTRISLKHRNGVNK
ncbi:unnamed protein product [Diabrotica balteata]|uniref:G-protein coupled receptors family 2 profile 2 domain-containing protein n=1 Tax=Diabrotica balteata TaxID=107213 RepID=A0A9P0DXN7_DIABA|nr:unnamed protein product [Diabrotica balteata]